MTRSAIALCFLLATALLSQGQARSIKDSLLQKLFPAKAESEEFTGTALPSSTYEEAMPSLKAL